jgi:hypothetical protein
MESIKEPVVHLIHNKGNVFEKLHMTPIQRWDTEAKMLSQNWKRHRVIEKTQ